MRWLLVLIAACAAKSEPPAIDSAAEPAWRAALVAERVKHDREFKTDVASPLAGVERFTPEATSYLTADGHLEAAPSAATVVTFEKTASGWTFASALTAKSADEKRTIPAGSITEPTLIRLSPRFAITAQLSGPALVIIVFDAQRPQLMAFTALSYFAPDAQFAARAKLDPIKPKPIQLATSRGLQKPFDEVGKLTFSIGGRALSLTAYKAAGQPELFVPFRDGTSGKESYGAARFLDIPEATPLVIDFNRAYNPLCAVSDAYNCPLPPPENTLPIAITAGERDPHLH